MEKKFDVVVLTAFGRGHFLANELRMSGMKVALVDATAGMGLWEPEDWEGPFGVFRHGSMSETQVGRLEEDARLELVEQGFTLWLKNGPVELHSRLTPYLLKQHQIAPETRSYVEQASRFEASAEKAPLRRQLLALPFAESWLCHFAHQFAANVFTGNAEALEHGTPLPLFSDWLVRRPSQEGFQESLNRLKERGVEVFSLPVLDLGVVNGVLDAVEVKSADAGLLRARYFVWALSSEDAQRFASQVREKLFPSGVLESEWAWVRYRIKLTFVEDMAKLPKKLVLMQDMHLPWAHENLCVCTQTQEEEFWDAWVRIPSQSRFQRGYLEKIAGLILEDWRSRVPGLQASTSEMPPDYIHNLDDIGAPRFPVFNRERLEDFKPASYRNFYFAGPEAWQNLDWSAQLAQHAGVAAKIRDTWARDLEKEKRRKS